MDELEGKIDALVAQPVDARYEVAMAAGTRWSTPRTWPATGRRGRDRYRDRFRTIPDECLVCRRRRS
jgi:hypothetical protein